MRRNTRDTVKQSHVHAGCPICLHEVDLAHEEALEFEGALVIVTDFDLVEGYDQSPARVPPPLGS